MKCPLCGGDGYQGLGVFECVNLDCENFVPGHGVSINVAAAKARVEAAWKRMANRIEVDDFFANPPDSLKKAVMDAACHAASYPGLMKPAPPAEGGRKDSECPWCNDALQATRLYPGAKEYYYRGCIDAAKKAGEKPDPGMVDHMARYETHVREHKP